ncbi:MAG: hypothetical protein FJ304_25970 [Planctomycetes bacterium]|nr:hypothetical protein [Planctomycetota bacterium]
MAKSKPISLSDVEKAQAEWVAAILAIGQAYTNGYDVVAEATKQIEALYGYKVGTKKVLFKPTKCAVRQFRPTFEGALSYFVGHALAPAGFAEDGGFAITPFIDVRFNNAGVIIEDGRALAMGNYFFTPADGTVIKVEYTFGYYWATASAFVIDLHHSSLPYQPAHP